jgi:glycosyltransferase involved in cell wall biosynthesis
MLILTVAICTYNRHYFLEKCLTELLPQVFDTQGVRVLVIDNNSTDNTAELVLAFQKQYLFLDYTFCHEQGLSFARNCALEKCQSIWLSFLDDDGYPEENWLDQNLKIIKSKKYDAFGGVYLPWFKDGKRSWFKGVYETNAFRMPQTDETRLAPGDSYFSGGNCSFNVEAILASGGFPLTLGMNGKVMGYGEEVAAQRSMAINGYVLGFSSQLVIHHYVPLSKQSIRWAWRREYYKGRDFWSIYSKPPILKNIILYTKVRFKESFNLSRNVISKCFSIRHSESIKNVCYEMSVWAGLIGLITGAFKIKISSLKRFIAIS